MDDPTFKDLHPYGLEPGQISQALWLLCGLLLFAIVSYIVTVIMQIMSSGLSARTLMGMKPRNPGREKRESEVREKARSNNPPRNRNVY